MQVSEYELKPGCGSEPVTEENKREYVELMVTWRLSRCRNSQMNSLRQGLREMLPLQYLTDFDSQELEWVIAGTAEINMEDWKKHTLYWGCKLTFAPFMCMVVWKCSHIVMCVCSLQQESSGDPVVLGGCGGLP